MHTINRRLGSRQILWLLYDFLRPHVTGDSTFKLVDLMKTTIDRFTHGSEQERLEAFSNRWDHVLAGISVDRPEDPVLCALFYEQVREFRCLELDMQLWDRDVSVRNYAYLRTVCVNAITTWRRRRNQEKIDDTLRLRTVARADLHPEVKGVQDRQGVVTPGKGVRTEGARQDARHPDDPPRDVDRQDDIPAVRDEQLPPRLARCRDPREDGKSATISRKADVREEADASTCSRGDKCPYKHVKPGAPAESTPTAAPAPAEPAPTSRRAMTASSIGDFAFACVASFDMACPSVKRKTVSFGNTETRVIESSFPEPNCGPVNRERNLNYSWPEDIRGLNSARERRRAHMKAVLWREQVLLDDVDAKTLGNDACVLELTLSQRSACEVFAAAVKSIKRVRRLMLDSGCGIDLIGLGDLSREERDLIVQNAKISLRTANGKTNTKGVAHMRIDGLDELIEAYVLESTPSLLSLGKRCKELGYRFIWEPFCDPIFFDPKGRQLKIDVINNIPYLAPSETEVVAGRPDLPRVYPALPAPIIIHAKIVAAGEEPVGELDDIGELDLDMPGVKSAQKGAPDDVKKGRTNADTLRAFQQVFGDLKDVNSFSMDVERRYAPSAIREIYCDKAREFISTCKRVGISVKHSTPGMPRTNAIAESKVKLVLHGARVALRQAGLSAKFWPYACKHFCHARNIELREGQSAYSLRFDGAEFDGQILPFGCLVDFYPTPARKQTRRSQKDEVVLGDGEEYAVPAPGDDGLVEVEVGFDDDGYLEWIDGDYGGTSTVVVAGLGVAEVLSPPSFEKAYKIKKESGKEFKNDSRKTQDAEEPLVADERHIQQDVEEPLVADERHAEPEQSWQWPDTWRQDHDYGAVSSEEYATWPGWYDYDPETGWWDWVEAPKSATRKVRWGRASQRSQSRPQPRTQTHRLEQRATALRARDWSAHELPVLVTAGKLQECLKQGLPVPGSVCEFWSLDALEHVQELWNSFGCDVSVTRGRWGSQLENVAILPLGNRKSPTIQAAIKVDVAKVPTGETKVAVKVTAPTCYRSAFRKDPGAADTPAEVLTALSSAGQVRVSDLLGGNWAVRDKDQGDKEALTGFLRLKPDVCSKLLKVSGQFGVFVTRLRKPQEVGPKPFWIRRLDKEEREKYYRRVVAMHKERGQAILFRAGGGSDLGFEAKDSDDEPARAKQLVMQGFPREWGEEEAHKFLSDLKWSDVSFSARRGKRWYLKASGNGTTTKQTVPTTQLDDEAARERSPRRASSDQTDNQDEAGASGKAAAAPASAHAGFAPPADPSDALERNWKRIDYGGVGDCFFRACAGVRAAQGGELINPRQSELQGALLRAWTVQHLKNHESRFMELWKDKEAFQAFKKKVSAQSTWACGSLVQALSEKVGTPIIVWESKDNEWTRFVVAGKFFSSGFACIAKDSHPIVLILSNKHYEALIPPSPDDVPRSWLRETPTTIVDLLGAGRGMTPPSEPATPSLHSLGPRGSDCKAPATPSVHTVVGSQKRAKAKGDTPSLHTFVRSGEASSSRQSRDRSQEEGTPSLHTWGQDPAVPRESDHLGHSESKKGTAASAVSSVAPDTRCKADSEVASSAAAPALTKAALKLLAAEGERTPCPLQVGDGGLGHANTLRALQRAKQVRAYTKQARAQVKNCKPHKVKTGDYTSGQAYREKLKLRRAEEREKQGGDSTGGTHAGMATAADDAQTKRRVRTKTPPKTTIVPTGAPPPKKPTIVTPPPQLTASKLNQMATASKGAWVR
ncbi:JNK [Symbiodinium sp. CCMP2592]|nr:JNK [Symbiodinium sp. CCMP2592]